MHRFVEHERNRFETRLKAFEALGRQRVEKVIVCPHV
jgi:hypothetical protein